MSLLELGITEGPLAAAYLLAIGALAFGMIPVTEKRLHVARNCFLASCAIFAGIAIMWGITTDLPPPLRLLGGLTGLAGIAAVESTRFIMREIAPREMAVSGPPYFDLRVEVSPSSYPTVAVAYIAIKPIDRVRVFLEYMTFEKDKADPLSTESAPEKRSWTGKKQATLPDLSDLYRKAEGKIPIVNQRPRYSGSGHQTPFAPIETFREGITVYRLSFFTNDRDIAQHYEFAIDYSFDSKTRSDNFALVNLQELKNIPPWK
jgi:hypothetical protein